MQALWGTAVAGACYAVISILASVTLIWFAGAFIGAAVFALITGAAAAVVAVMLFKGSFSRMNLPDRRLVAFIVLGITGLTTLSNLLLSWGPAWYVLLSVLILLAQAAAIGISFFLLLQAEVVGWLNAQPGPTPTGLSHQPPPQEWTGQPGQGHHPPQPPPPPGQYPPPPHQPPPGQYPQS